MKETTCMICFRELAVNIIYFLDKDSETYCCMNCLILGETISMILNGGSNIEVRSMR